MLTPINIDQIFAKAYCTAAVDKEKNMMLAADMLESLRPQFVREDVYKIWNRLRLDQVKFDNSFGIRLLRELKKSFYDSIYENLEQFIFNYSMQPETEMVERNFTIAYTTALVNFKSEIYARLCRDKFPVSPAFEEKIQTYNQLHHLILDNQWVEAFDILGQLEQVEYLPDHLKSALEVMRGQVVLYLHADNKGAAEYFERAMKSDPESNRPHKGMSEFYFRTQQYESAVGKLMPLLTRDPFDVELYNLLGDTNKEKADTSVAEGWYKDAIELNFFHSDAYSKLIVLYGSNADLFKENKHKIPELLEKVKQVDPDIEDGNIYYMALRDAGLAHANNTDYQGAALYYTKAKELRPELTSAYVDLGYIRAYQKDNPEAEKIFKQAIEIDPNSYEAWWGLAYLFEQTGNMPLSLQSYEKCLELRPAWSDRIHNSMGVTCHNLKNYEKAVGYYKQAIEENQHETVYYNNLELSYKEMGNTSDLAQFYKQMAAKYPGNQIVQSKLVQETAAPSLKATAAGSNSDQIVYLEQRAKEFESQGKWREAEEQLQKLLTIDQSKNSFNSMGNHFFRQQLYDRAIEYYSKAIEVGPPDAVIFENMGLAHERKGILDKAEEYYGKGLQIAPDDPYINNRLGVMKYNQFKDDEAIAHYNKAIGSNPNNAIYYTNLGLAWESKKNLEEAEKAYLKAYSVDPKDAETCNNLGILKYKQEKYEEAIKYYLQAIANKGNDDVYYSNLGKAYTKQNTAEALAQAIMAFSKAVELNPNSDQHRNYLGVTYYKQYKSDKALEQYQEAIRIKPDNYVYYDNVGLAQKDLGNFEEAIKSFLKAADLAPEKEKWFYYNEVGVIYHNRHNYAKAIEHYELSVKFNNSNEVVWKNISSAYAALGDKEKEREALDKANLLLQKQ